MKEIIRYIKLLFGKYEPGYEYWVYTKDIKSILNGRERKLEKKNFQEK